MNDITKDDRVSNEFYFIEYSYGNFIIYCFNEVFNAMRNACGTYTISGPFQYTESTDYICLYINLEL